MIDIEPKGLDLPKRELPKILEKVKERFEKPEIDVGFWSLVELYGVKAVAKVTSLVLKEVLPAIIKQAIPTWFWFALIGVIVSILFITLI